MNADQIPVKDNTDNQSVVALDITPRNIFVKCYEIRSYYTNKLIGFVTVDNGTELPYWTFQDSRLKEIDYISSWVNAVHERICITKLMQTT